MTHAGTAGSTTLADALPKEMARVRELIPLYEEIPTGAFAVAFMKADLGRAERAMAEGDVVEMIRAYQSLKEYSA